MLSAPRASLVVTWALVACAAARGAAADSFVIRADWFDRGNVTFAEPRLGYADKYPTIWNKGQLPNVTEYDVDFPVTAKYTIVALYAAMASRPVDIYLDGKLLVRAGFKSTTGSWLSSTAKWEMQCQAEITQGKHTVKLQRAQCIPHICALRFESQAPFPKAWRLRRRVKREQDEVDLTGFVCGYPTEPPDQYDYHQPFKRVGAPTPNAHRVLEFTLMGEGRYRVDATVRRWGDAGSLGSADRDELLQKRSDSVAEPSPWVADLSVKVSGERTDRAELPLSVGHLRKMLGHTAELVDGFRAMAGVPADFLSPEGREVGRMSAQLDAVMALKDGQGKWERFYALYVAAYRLKHRVALSNPLIDFDRLLMAKRLTYGTSHIYTTYYDGSRRYKAGSGIFVLSPVRPDGALTLLTGKLPTDAIYRDPELSWDAQRVLFSCKPDLPTPCRIHEVGIDGQGLRQLTDSEYDDVDPCYLPNGKIMFVSTRCRRVTLCHNAFTVSVLHTMNADGSGTRCVSSNTIHDFRPSVMRDGRIAFTRWEYVDKHLGNQQSMWTCNPDGTRVLHVVGNHFGPLTFWGARHVPGTRLLACVLAPHMPIAVGPVALVDPTYNYSSPAVYESITPELPPATHFSWLRKDVGYYTDVFPLSEDYYLVAYCYGPDDRNPVGYGIYLLDRWNNRDLVYRDPELSAFEPYPVKPRPRPMMIPEQEAVACKGGEIEAGTATGHGQDGEAKTALFYVVNVYEGLSGVAPGDIKYLRITEEIPKPVSMPGPGFAIQYPVISNRGHLAAKRLWGTVPVESDGSAYFRAPANRALYFAALDESYMEVQRMRSFTQAAPGEFSGCIGCHEPKHNAPVNRRAKALYRPPSQITPPPHGGVHGPDFYYDVQPVLNKHCTRCHSGPEPKGGIDLSPDYTSIFNVAYETLTKRKLVSYVNCYGCRSLPTRPPKYYGSHASPMVKAILTTHQERVRLPQEDFRRIVTWIDCNAPYYGTYTYNQAGTIGGRELVPQRLQKPLNDVYRRRCQSCHGPRGHDRIRQARLPAVEGSPALLAPLAKAAGGTEACGRPIFKDRSDPDFEKLASILAEAPEEAKRNPRADMLGHRPRIIDPYCRYVFRP